MGETSDIVARLRFAAETTVDDPRELAEAADEIERLRADAARLDWLEAERPMVAAQTDGGWIVYRRGDVRWSFKATLREVIDAAQEEGGPH